MLILNSKLIVQGSKIQVYNGNILPVEGSILYLDAGNASSYPGTGTNWYDISGQGMSASLVNTPTYQTTSGSFKLDGTNQYMFVSGNSTLNAIDAFTNSYTIEVWAKSSLPTLTKSGTRLIEKRGALGNYPVSIQIVSSSGQNTTAFVFDNTNAPGVHISSGSTLWDNTWRQIVFVADFTTDTLRSYKNGSFMSSSTNTVTATTANTEVFLIGSNKGNTVPFSGEIAIVRVYNTALTANEINRNWISTKDRFGL